MYTSFKTFGILLLSLVMSSAFCKRGAKAPATEANAKPFPALSVVDMKGNAVELKDFAKGKTKVISFWATWCGPCKRELNAYNGTFAKWRKDYNAELIAVSVDQGKSVEQLANFSKTMGWNFTVLFDKDEKASPMFNIEGIPFMMVVDKKGNIVKTQTGFDPDETKLEKLLASLK